MELLAIVIGAAMALAAPGSASPVPAFSHIQRALVKPDRHVRSADPRVTTALFDGVRRSRTFAALIDALDRTDVIAYVDLAHELPRAARGRMLLASSANGIRYVRIQIHTFLAPDEIIAVLGHELQHALEVAGRPDIQDEASMRRFYTRAGAGVSDANGYETPAARTAGDLVKREVRASYSQPRQASNLLRPGRD
jgi:hypothetical protein